MKKTSRTVKLGIIILAGTALLVGTILCLNLFFESLPQIPHKIFASIDEIKPYDKYTVDFLDESIDRYISEDMIITDCTVRELKYKEQKYMLYAYVFESSEMEKTYYTYHGIKYTSNASGSYHLESIIGGHTIFVCYGNNCAYKIMGDSYIDMHYLLNECSSSFSTEILL